MLSVTTLTTLSASRSELKLSALRTRTAITSRPTCGPFGRDQKAYPSSAPLGHNWAIPISHSRALKTVKQANCLFDNALQNETLALRIILDFKGGNGHEKHGAMPLLRLRL